jgi:Transposase family tnp2
MINNFPAFSNIFGLKMKGAKSMSYLRGKYSVYKDKNCKKKNMEHCMFLTRYHPYRQKKKEFDGKVETRQA